MEHDDDDDDDDGGDGAARPKLRGAAAAQAAGAKHFDNPSKIVPKRVAAKIYSRMGLSEYDTEEPISMEDLYNGIYDNVKTAELNLVLKTQLKVKDTKTGTKGQKIAQVIQWHVS